ncbi:MAG: exosortase-associated EpsI family protein [Verrucomicrobiota bacterium]
MNAKVIVAGLLVLAFAGVTAVTLDYVKGHHRLTPPGVKVVPEALKDEDGKPVGTNSVYLPPVVLGGKGKLMPVTKMERIMLPSDTTFGRMLYEWPDQPTLYTSVVLMGADRTSMHAAQYCLIGQGWTIDDTRQISVPIAQPRAYQMPVTQLLLSRQVSHKEEMMTVRAMYLYWFVSNDGVVAQTAKHHWASSMQVIREGTVKRWAYVSMLALYAPGQEASTLARVKQLIAEIVPQVHLDSTLPAMLTKR